MSLGTGKPTNVEKCSICGKEVADFAGHWVPTTKTLGPSDGAETVPGAPEFHCFECDPISMNQAEVPTAPYAGGN